MDGVARTWVVEEMGDARTVKDVSRRKLGHWLVDALVRTGQMESGERKVDSESRMTG